MTVVCMLLGWFVHRVEQAKFELAFDDRNVSHDPRGEYGTLFDFFPAEDTTAGKTVVTSFMLDQGDPTPTERFLAMILRRDLAFHFLHPITGIYVSDKTSDLSEIRKLPRLQYIVIETNYLDDNHAFATRIQRELPHVKAIRVDLSDLEKQEGGFGSG